MGQIDLVLKFLQKVRYSGPDRTSSYIPAEGVIDPRPHPCKGTDRPIVLNLLQRVRYSTVDQDRPSS